MSAEAATATPGTAIRPRQRPSVVAAPDAEVEEILKDPRSKAYKDLRDRAAYMYVTGTYPSHLRRFFTRMLGMIASMHRQGVSMDGRSGTMKVREDIVSRLQLAEHPMVAKVRTLVDQGWRIQISRGQNERKPYTKVFLFRGRGQAEKCTVQIDGSTKDHWG